jgi:hypothetical protein
MGCYCSLHGFHPASENHTSATCQWKQPNHNVTAMWNNRKGGSVHWPPPICLSIKQQNHGTYVGKSAPTNCEQKEENSKAMALKLKLKLSTNFYSIQADRGCAAGTFF